MKHIADIEARIRDPFAAMVARSATGTPAAQAASEEDLAAAREYLRVKALNPFEAARAMRDDGGRIARGLDALREAEPPEPEAA